MGIYSGEAGRYPARQFVGWLWVFLLGFDDMLRYRENRGDAV